MCRAMPGLEISLFLCSPPHKMFKEMERQLISNWYIDTLLTEPANWFVQVDKMPCWLTLSVGSQGIGY